MLDQIPNSKQILFNHTERLALYRRGMLDCFAGPGLGLFVSMIGFGALCQTNGFDWLFVMIATFGIWGLPGQMAMVDLYASGAGLFGVLFGVGLINARMLVMTLSALPVIRPGQQKFSALNLLIAQILAVTSWAQIMRMASQLGHKQRLLYFMTFAGSVYIFGGMGAGVGYFAADLLPRPAVLALLILSPVYIFLLLLSAPQRREQLAILFGCISVPSISFFVSPDWGPLLGGLFGGSLAWFLMRPDSGHATS